MTPERVDVTERQYLVVSRLAQVRAAFEILRLAGPGDLIPEIPVGEYRLLMQCLDAWVARLEFATSHPDDKDKEPRRRDWPFNSIAT